MTSLLMVVLSSSFAEFGQSTFAASLVTLAIIATVVVLLVTVSRRLRHRLVATRFGPRGTQSRVALAGAILWLLAVSSRSPSSGNLTVDVANNFAPMLAAAAVFGLFLGWLRRFRPEELARMKDANKRYGRGEIDLREMRDAAGAYPYIGVVITLVVMVGYHSAVQAFGS